MRLLLVGARGQLGVDLQGTLRDEYEIIPLTQREMPVEDAARVQAVVTEVRPDAIVNCSAFHRVDECEVDVERTFAVNVFGVRNLAVSAREVGAILVSFSTDYVFDSERRSPYSEQDLPLPKSVYGVSKAAAELLLASLYERYYMIRTCGLYGYAGSREKKTNFVETMIGLARQGKPLRVVNDQVCTPTATADLTAAVQGLLQQRPAFGLYHLTAQGECSWYEFARSIFKLSGLSADVTPVTSAEFPTRARRPGYSVLDNRNYRSQGFEDLPGWEEGLERYIRGRAAHGR